MENKSENGNTQRTRVIWKENLNSLLFCVQTWLTVQGEQVKTCRRVENWHVQNCFRKDSICQSRSSRWTPTYQRARAGRTNNKTKILCKNSIFNSIFSSIIRSHDEINKGFKNVYIKFIDFNLKKSVSVSIWTIEKWHFTKPSIKINSSSKACSSFR